LFCFERELMSFGKVEVEQWDLLMNEVRKIQLVYGEEHGVS
jgi:hypothetical protein